MNSAVIAFVLMAFAISSSPALQADEPDFDKLAGAYQTEIRTLFKQYCHKCHSEERTEAEINLAAIATWTDVRKDSRTWEKVGEMLGSGQMPPEEERQPTDAERMQLRKWVSGYLTVEAKARAGDPGRVVLRRLSNAEYTYTIRDLTEIDSLDPAREFPIDGAAGEGFTNTGSALVMSPALVTKYLDAAKDVAGHAVLLPDGFRFSPHSTRRDWTEESLQRIREFYRQFTDASGGDKVNLQGIVFDTNQGGRLPLEKYLAATLIERESLRSGSKTIETVARDHGLNAKYFGILWSSLSDSKPSLLLDGLRQRWRTANAENVGAIATEVAQWQKGLWKFATVGHIGKVGGPTRWLEPVSPLVVQHEVRFKIPAITDGKDVTLSLVAADAGDGNDHDYVVLQQPRLVAQGRPDVLLRDVRATAAAKDETIGLDPAMFGKHPNGAAIDDASLCVRAPSVIELKLPADMAAGCELVTTGVLHKDTGAEGSVQLEVVAGKPTRAAGLLASEVTVAAANGPWTADNRKTSYASPILVSENSAARRRFETAFDDFRQLFPPALCYTKIVPVDEVVTLTLFYREDDHLVRLMLDDAQRRQLDRLWDELHYVSHDALTLVDAFAQLIEYATQDADPKVFEPLAQADSTIAPRRSASD